MAKRIAAILIVGMFFGIAALGADGGRQLRVIPAPKQVVWRDGIFKIGPKTVIVAANPSRASDVFAIGLL
ncbi:MAG: hypothetical protein WCX65_14670, partial [bacterium]